MKNLGGEICAPSWWQARDGCSDPTHLRRSAPYVEDDTDFHFVVPLCSSIGRGMLHSAADLIAGLLPGAVTEAFPPSASVFARDS